MKTRYDFEWSIFRKSYRVYAYKTQAHTMAFCDDVHDAQRIVRALNEQEKNTHGAGEKLADDT